MAPPKKAAKKTHGDHASHGGSGKDLRRAFEHLGRVEVLHASLAKGDAKDIATLTALAERELAAGHMKDAADLLRASEHLSFGALHPAKAAGAVNPKLKEEITKEFEEKLEKAEKHWSDEERNAEIEGIYASAGERARDAFDAGAYRRAMELARGVEALAHVKIHASRMLRSSSKQPVLSA